MLARVHEAFQFTICSGVCRKISEYFITESTALILILRGLAISLDCLTAVLMKLPERTMNSFGGGGDLFNPIRAAFPTRQHMSSITQKFKVPNLHKYKTDNHLPKMLASTCWSVSALESCSCRRILYASRLR